MNIVDQRWESCVRAFLRAKYAISNSEATLRNYQSILTQFFSRGIDPARVTRRDIEDFMNEPTHGRRSTGRPPSLRTKAKRRDVLSSLYTYAAQFTVIDSSGNIVPLYRYANPTLGIKLSKVAHEFRRRAFTASDLARFFAAIPTDTLHGIRDRAIFLTYFLTARRREEIIRLRYEDIYDGVVIDENGTSRSAHLYRFIGKGKAGAYDEAELPDMAYRAIMRYLDVSGRLRTIEPDDFLFTSIGRWPTSPVDPFSHVPSHVIYRVMKKYARAAGLDYRRLAIHSFRHSSARERYLLQRDPRAIQQVLRHASLQTTSIYLDELVSHGDSAARLLEEKFHYLFPDE